MNKSINKTIFFVNLLFLIILILPAQALFNARVLHGPSLGGTYQLPNSYGMTPGYELTYLNWVGFGASAGYRHTFFILDRPFDNESHFPAPYIEVGFQPGSFSFFKDRDKNPGFRFGAGLSFIYHQDIPIANAHLFMGFPIYSRGSIIEPYIRYVMHSSKEATKRSILEMGVQYRFVNKLGKSGLVGL